MARWLDIYHNPSSAAKNVQIRMDIRMNYQMEQKKSNTGKANFTAKDFAIWTRSPHNNNPAALHIPHGPKTKMRMGVSLTGSNRMQYTTNLKIPAGQTVILAFFEAQNQNTKKLDDIMKKFSPKDYFSDLSIGVRKRILNFRASGGMLDIEIDRSGRGDVVKTLGDTDVITGEVQNAEFKLVTQFGEIVMKASRIIGMKLRDKNKPEDFLVILKDGQVISGKLPESKLEIKAGGDIYKIPFKDIKMWSFKMSKKDADNEVPFTGPYLFMQSGDRLVFDPKSVDFGLQTRNGAVKLSTNHIHRIELGSSGSSTHKVLFQNQSTLSGLLEPNVLNVDLQLKKGQKIRRNELVSIAFTQESKQVKGLTSVVMSTGDRFFGRLADNAIKCKQKYTSTKEIKRESILSITKPAKAGEGQFDIIRVDNMNKTRGQLAETMNFTILPGPTIEFSTIQMKSLTRSLTSSKVVDKDTEKLIVQLGSESWQDRKEAQKQLEERGKDIIPVLKKYVDDEDPEIRNRVRAILEKLE